MHFVANKLELLRYLNFVVSFLAAVKVKLEERLTITSCENYLTI